MVGAPPLRRCRRYAALAAGAGALASLVGPGAAPGAPSSARVTVSDTNRVVREGTVNVVIPRAEGVLTMSVSTAPLQLGPVVLSDDGRTVVLTSQLGAMTVTDNRYQSQPGWSLSGQVSDFTGGGPTFSGSYLGWTPVVIAQNPDRDVATGRVVGPGTRPGLRDGGGLAAAAEGTGTGTTVVGATLVLRLPASTSVRSQTATLTVTLVIDP